MPTLATIRPADPPMMPPELAHEVSQQEWYHTMDLDDHVTTPGFFDHRPVIDRYAFPKSLEGARVLDVGTFDGFFAFEMERRGAREVVAIDVPDVDSLDWPEPLRRKGTTRFQPKHANFEIAKRALASEVRREFVSIYDVTPERFGSFDHVFIGSLLIHLRDPVLALMKLRDVCGGTIHSCEVTHGGLNLLSRWYPLARFQAISSHLTWWIPNRRCLSEWFEAAGYHRIAFGDTFRVPFGQAKGGIRHTVIKAEPLR